MLKRLLAMLEDRTGLGKALGPLAAHPVPPDVGWWYVLGSATLTAFVIQVVTGIALATAYVPSAGSAYQSLEYISHRAVFGHLLRGMHYFGASAMVLLIGLHAIRVFLMGAFKYPREASWITGVVLLALTLLMGFTGQLLRWDQNAIASVVVAAEQAGRAPFVGTFIAHFLLGGDVVGGATLSRFFAVHVFLVPAGIFAFIGLHLFLVIRNGISEPPVPGRRIDRAGYREWYDRMLHERGIPFWPDAAWRDALFACLVVLAVAVLAGVVGAPELTKPPDPTLVHGHPQPDWYILWYYAVLALIPAGSESYVIILFPLVVGVGLMLLPVLWGGGERSVQRRPWAAAAVLCLVTMVGTLSVVGAEGPWSPDFHAPPLPLALVGAGSPPAVLAGATAFHEKGCEYCHAVGAYGGHRGPDLSTIGDRLTEAQMIIRIFNGGTNMPAFAGNLKPDELRDLVAFLRSRTSRATKAVVQTGAAAPP
ncbi:MAG: cytochrome b N-terminal domain-containing protein [Deltaproteobacteria bacterium]